MTTPSVSADSPRFFRPAAFALVLALAYAAIALGVTVVRERDYFVEHAALRARALSIPSQLTATEDAIRAEQSKIMAAQKAIAVATGAVPAGTR